MNRNRNKRFHAFQGDRAYWLVLATGLVWGLGGCSSSGSPEAAVAAEPIVGPLELSVSHRMGGTEPIGFARIEVSPTAVQVDGQPVLTLQGGRIADAERSGRSVPVLKQALDKSTHRGGAALEVHAQVPYATLAVVLGSVVEAGLPKLSFKVRKPGGAIEFGWLTPDSVQVIAPSGESEVSFGQLAPRPWSDFVELWETVQGGCRSAATGSCAFKPEATAEGGQLKVGLHAQGDGVNLRFHQVGAPEPTAAAKRPAVEMLDGVRRVDPVADVEQAPPATYAEFQFRAREALNEANPVAETMKPVCGSRACGVVVSAEGQTHSMRILSLIGAAFPDGTAAPSLAFELP